ncbi:MAG: alanine racemase [Leadbetterella sp.]
MQISQFELQNLDSPRLIFDKEAMERNISKMIVFAGNPKQLIPHIKTNKCLEVIEAMIERGIVAFKCATIAEAELACMAKASYVLIAHQLVGPKISRLKALKTAYPNVEIASIIDCKDTLPILDSELSAHTVLVDVNVGMDRTGIHGVKEIESLVDSIKTYKNLEFGGFHAYDGHIHDGSLEIRKIQTYAVFKDINILFETLSQYNTNLKFIGAGSPTYTIWKNSNKFLSPGTCVLWDYGYGDLYPEQDFEFAAFVLTRVISKPKSGYITVDMGHKAISAENPIEFRCRALDKRSLKLVSQSEEHSIFEVENNELFQIGEELLIVPYHVCPTVNLYDEAYVIENGKFKFSWEILGRKRKITI